MQGIQEQLIELRKLSEKLTQIERKRQQLKIIGKTVSLINKLEAVERKLKSPSRTAGDLKKHMLLLTELRLLYRMDEQNSPLNVIKTETELVGELYSGLIDCYQKIIAKINNDNQT